MLFNTFEFLVFFISVLIAFFSTPKKARWFVLLLASYIFYGYWKASYLFIIAGSTFVDYFISNAIGKSTNQKRKKTLLFISITVNLSVLILFKYYDFLINSFNDVSEALDSSFKFKLLNLVLPVGISFYTFQTMSYTVDVYNGKLKPENHIGIFALFVSFFPQLVAGPIERATNLLPQLKKDSIVDYSKFASGAQLILWGLVKKVIVADRVGLIANEIFNNYQDYHGFTLIIGIICFAFQIYCDFSGYSDIAIGVARTMGYDLMKNFNTPYFSVSLTDFWRRWHISLSTWFKDYIYIPLGGNRVLKWRWYFNLWITFFISGIWHGSNWTFVIWGAIHGFGLVLENLIKFKPSNKILVFKKLWIFALVCIAWIFFRANHVSDAFEIIAEIFNFGSYNLSQLSPYVVPVSQETVYSADFVLAYASIGSLLLVEHFLIVKRKWEKIPSIPKLMVYSITIVFIFMFGVFDLGEFIYFQF